MNRTALRTISLLAILALCSVWAFGQAETGQIAGTIKDASGAVVSGAKVTAKGVNTGLTRDSVTNTSGLFTIPSLRPGPYEVTIEATGFQKTTQQVQVAVGAVVDMSTQLKVGGAATTVEVTGSGEATAVNTENSTMGASITSQEVNELPTLTRNPYDMVGTAGNVTLDTNSGRGAGYTINGQRSSSTDILLDGGQNVDLFTASVGQQVPLDSVQEFSVLTNGFGAEYGRASGGIVNVVTKSGTNQFHGSAYEYNRLSALSSNTYYNDANDIKKGVFTRNQFGFSVGGPIVKNKLFFFENAEWIRVRSTTPVSFNIIDPGSYSQLAPASQAFFSQYGKFAPGVTTKSSFPCLTGSTVTCDQVVFPVASQGGGGYPQNTWMEVARVDYNLSDTNTIFGRYASYHEVDEAGTVNYSPYAGYDTGANQYDQNVTINWTHVFSPNIVNTANLIYNRLNGPTDTLGPAPIGPTLYTTTAVPSLPANGLQLVFPGYNEISPGGAIPFGGPQNVYQAVDNLSWTKGKHQFKFGGGFVLLRDNRVFGAYENAVETLGTDNASALANLLTGNIYEFESAIYPQGKYPCPKNEAGHTVVSPACTLQLPVGSPAFGRNYRYNDGDVYAQDSWKVTPRLTVNYGLRWEYYGVQHNANPALDSNFVFGPGSTEYNRIRNGQVELASQGGVFWKPDYKNWGPRVGFAYDVFGDGTTSVRGGYGISYERNFGNVTFNAIQNPPNYGVIQIFSNQTVPFNQPVYTNNFGPLVGTGSAPLPAVSQRAINQNIQTAYAETWDFSIQRQIARNSVIAVDYAGSHGVHLYDIANINPGTGGNDGYGGGGLYLGDPRIANRLNYQYSNMNYRSDGGYNHYDAINIRWTSNNMLNKGLNLTANYTWSHALDNLSSTFTEQFGGLSGAYQLGYLDAFNPKLNYGNSDYNIPNRFVLSGVWDMPWMKNASNAFERLVLGGWSIGSVFNVRSGNPFSVYDCSNFNGTSCPLWVPSEPTARSGSNQGAVGPNLFNYIELPNSGGIPVNIGDSLGLPNCTGLVHNGCTYTTSGLPYPGRNAYIGPGYWNIDMNFYKNFKITERFTLQFRAEMYNIFNHNNLYITTLNLDASSLGQPFIQAEKGGIYGYAGQPTDERRNIQFALRLMF